MTEELPDYVGSVDLTDTENIDVKNASVELTNRRKLHNTKDRVKGGEVERKDELGTGEFEEVFDRLYAQGVEQVTLTGGEPTERDDFHELLQYAINLFDTVNVQTDGYNNDVLSDYNCNVVICIEAADRGFNNSVRRVSNPDVFEYVPEKEKLVSKSGGFCKYCREELKNGNGIRNHLKFNHRDKAIQTFNDASQELGFDSVSEWTELKDVVTDSEDIRWQLYVDQEADASRIENGLEKAVDKARKIDNDTVIRASIYNSNNIEEVVTLAEEIGSDTVFVPLKPVGGVEENMSSQVPSPGRMEDVMEKVYEFDLMFGNSHRVKSPHYTAYRLKRLREEAGLTEQQEEELESYWRRGRVSGVGVEGLHVLPDGRVCPSPYLRDRIVGDLSDGEWGGVAEGLAEFNEVLSDIIEPVPCKGYDMRQRCLACDPDFVLNKPYKNKASTFN